MRRPFQLRSWSWCLAPCSAGLLTAAAQGQQPLFANHNPSAYAGARDAVYQPLSRQASNGMVLDHTVWNHYFKEDGSAELHSSGYYFLDRIAKRASGDVLPVYLQTARDATYNPKAPTKFVEYRAKIDVERAQAVAAYFRDAYPHVAFRIHLVDPPPAGMSGLEAAKAVGDLRNSARGTLPPDLLQGIGSYLRGGGGGGDPGGASPVTSGTGLGSGAFGSEAPGPGGSPGGATTSQPTSPSGGPGDAPPPLPPPP